LIFNERRARIQPGPPLAGYPSWARSLIVWFDDLTDWQRIKYALAAILFLVACIGYLLGLGSTMVVQRVALESEALAAAPLPSAAPTATASPPTAVAIAALPTSTPTAPPSPIARPATPAPSATPFAAPQIAEPRAVPRSIPAQAPPAIAPVAPLRASPTPERPRNVETTPTPPVARTALPTAVRQVTPATPVARPTSASGTPLPTLALPATREPTPGGQLTATTPTAPTPTSGGLAATPRPPTTPTIVRTPPVR
jgi:hypothetical protein